MPFSICFGALRPLKGTRLPKFDLFPLVFDNLFNLSVTDARPTSLLNEPSCTSHLTAAVKAVEARYVGVFYIEIFIVPEYKLPIFFSYTPYMVGAGTAVVGAIGIVEMQCRLPGHEVEIELDILI